VWWRFVVDFEKSVVSLKKQYCCSSPRIRIRVAEAGLGREGRGISLSRPSCFSTQNLIYITN
jgi:hypothetical protein